MTSMSYMRAPESGSTYEVGDIVEVLCDHDKDTERVRGWQKGIIVQVDTKLLAVQFRTDVYLTDGWMVPDHILWFPVNSPNVRYPQKKNPRKDSY